MIPSSNIRNLRVAPSVTDSENVSRPRYTSTARKPLILTHSSKDDLCTPTPRQPKKISHLEKNDYALLRTTSENGKVELLKQANGMSHMNRLGTPSSFVFLNGSVDFSTYSGNSSIQSAHEKKKWGNQPNLIFSPTLHATDSRTGLTLVLDHPGMLHASKTSSTAFKNNLTIGPPKSDLHERMKTMGEAIVNSWEKDSIKNGVNRGMTGKYTQLALHDKIQGMMFFHKGREFIDAVRDAIPENGAELRAYVAKKSEFSTSPEFQKKIFESQKKYVQYIASRPEQVKSPKTVEAIKVYEKYLSEGNSDIKSYFEVIGKNLHASMRQELLSHYEYYSNFGLRHNESYGRLFPWETKGIDIGHIDDISDMGQIKTQFANAKRFIMDYEKSRKLLLEQFSVKGIEHPVIKEFIDAKSAMLQEKGEASLTNDEKSEILNNIVHNMQQPIKTYSYQAGELKQVDLPSDITSKADSQDILTKERFVDISNQLRNFFNKQEWVSDSTASSMLKSLPEVDAISTPDEIIDNKDLTLTARKAVRAFLATGIEFRLHTEKADSGALHLNLLKEKNPHLSDRKIVEKNIEKFSIDSCMSIISSMQGVNWASSAKFEAAHSDSKKADYPSMAHLDYSDSVLHNYTSATPLTETISRPLQDTKTQAYKLGFSKLEKNIKSNMTEAWEARNIDASLFRKRITNFIDDVKTKYAIDLSSTLNVDDVGEVWNQLSQTQITTFGKKHNYELTQGFFNTLGADWSRSQDIKDESTLRQEYDRKDWNINPHGEMYRQHKVGKGNIVAFAPSQGAIEIAKKEIAKGRNPFRSLADMHHILDKLNDKQGDRFALHAIFMNQEVVSGLSSNSLRMINYWEREVLQKLSDEDKGLAPDLSEMISLTEAYCGGGKHHHSSFEINTVLESRKFPVR